MRIGDHALSRQSHVVNFGDDEGAVPDNDPFAEARDDRSANFKLHLLRKGPQSLTPIPHPLHPGTRKTHTHRFHNQSLRWAKKSEPGARSGLSSTITAPCYQSSRCCGTTQGGPRSRRNGTAQDMTGIRNTAGKSGCNHCCDETHWIDNCPHLQVTGEALEVLRKKNTIAPQLLHAGEEKDT